MCSVRHQTYKWPRVKHISRDWNYKHSTARLSLRFTGCICKENPEDVHWSFFQKLTCANCTLYDLGEREYSSCIKIYSRHRNKKQWPPSPRTNNRKFGTSGLWFGYWTLKNPGIGKSSFSGSHEIGGIEKLFSFLSSGGEKTEKLVPSWLLGATGSVKMAFGCKFCKSFNLQPRFNGRRWWCWCCSGYGVRKFRCIPRFDFIWLWTVSEFR